eukprot:4107160-Pleurochrysis_carterae.AAC.1
MPTVVLAQARARTCDLYSCLQACLTRAPRTAFVHAVVQQYLLGMSTYLISSLIIPGERALGGESCSWHDRLRISES